MRNWCARLFSSGGQVSLLLLSAPLGHPAAADDSPTLTGNWGAYERSSWIEAST